MVVEGTHFRRTWSSPHEIGARAIAQAASDITAMGAHPRYIVLALCLPGHLPIADVAEIGQGAAAAARAAGARIVGGDITSGTQLVLAPTAVGELTGPSGRAVTLSGAQPGDILALTGHPGRAAAGHALIEAGHLHGPAQQAFRVPEPPYALGPVAAASGAHALTDVTDGLLRDTHALARASGVVAALDYPALGADAVLEAAATQLTAEKPEQHREELLRSWRLSGGEDHGLLAAFAPRTPLPQGFRAVGVIQHVGGDLPAGTVLVDGNSTAIVGWDSARGSSGPH